LKRVMLAIFANVIAFGTVFSIWKVVTNKMKKSKQGIKVRMKG